MVAPIAVIYLTYMTFWGGMPERSISQLSLLALGGAVTVAPLIWFAAAAVRLPLTTLGFFQYLAPSISLVLAVQIYGESVAPARWFSFGLIWLALVIFSAEGLYHHRRKVIGEETA